MTITFQVQIDPINSNREFSDFELEILQGYFNTFVGFLDNYDFVRAGMYIDNSLFIGNLK